MGGVCRQRNMYYAISNLESDRRVCAVQCAHSMRTITANELRFDSIRRTSLTHPLTVSHTIARTLSIFIGIQFQLIYLFSLHGICVCPARLCANSHLVHILSLSPSLIHLTFFWFQFLFVLLLLICSVVVRPRLESFFFFTWLPSNIQKIDWIWRKQ